MALIKLPKPTKTTPPTQTDRILRMLKHAGFRGVPNYEFPKHGILRYSARIDELRKDGFNIYCEQQKVQGRATGVFLYFLLEVK